MRLDYCCNDDRAEDPEPGAWSREALEAMDAGTRPWLTR